MKYMGSKARFAKHIALIVNTALGNSSGILYEPFCGGCNLTPHFKGKVIANDINESLIELFKAAIKGRAFPTYVSREMYNEAKNGQLDKALTAYIGFCSSYNGRYFAGYVGNDHPIANGRTRNYQQEAIKNFLNTVKRLRAMESLELTSVPYYEMEIENNSIVYCDPLIWIRQVTKPAHLTAKSFGSGPTRRHVITWCLLVNTQPYPSLSFPYGKRKLKPQ